MGASIPNPVARACCAGGITCILPLLPLRMEDNAALFRTTTMPRVGRKGPQGVIRRFG